MANNRRFVYAIAITFVVTAVALFFEDHLMITVTDSLKYRVWYLDKRVPSTVKKGDYVVFPFSDPIATKGAQVDVTKRVGCASGGFLRVEDRRYYCDGTYLGTALTLTLSGRRVDNFVFNGPVPEGKVFVIGDHPASYDSRYWGLLDVRTVHDTAHPLREMLKVGS
jgi:conjugal transfer pilin signal peptidase TrbI